MPLAWQRIRYAFTGGQDESIDPRAEGVQAAQEATNVDIRKAGAYQTRSGFQSFTSTGLTSVTRTRRIFSTGRELCLIGDESLYAYAPGRSTWLERGRVGVGSGRTTGAFRDSFSYTQGDLCGNGTVFVAAAIAEVVDVSGVVTSDATTHSYVVADVRDATGRKLIDRAVLNGGSWAADYPTAVRASQLSSTNALVTYLYDNWAAGAGLDLFYNALDTSALGSGFGAATLLQGGVLNVGTENIRTYDVAGNSANFYTLVYVDHATGSIIAQRRNVSTHAINATGTYAPPAGTFNRVAAWYDASAGRLYVIGATSVGTVRLVRANATTLVADYQAPLQSAPVGFTYADNLAVRTRDAGARVSCVWTWFGGVGSGTVCVNARASDGVDLRARGPVFNAINRTRVFGGVADGDTAGARTLTELAVNYGLFPSTTTGELSMTVDSASVHTEHFVVDWKADDTSASLNADSLVSVCSRRDVGTAVVMRTGTDDSQTLLGSAQTVAEAFLSTLHPTSMRTVSWASVVRSQSKVGRRDRFAVDLETLGIGDAVQTENTARGLCVVGGSVVCSYDGQSVFDLGVPAPKIGLVSDAVFAAGVLAGDYVYMAMHEATDVTGTVHRSAPSQPAEGTVVGPNNGMNLRTESCPNTNRPDGAVGRISIQWYRAGTNGQFLRVEDPMYSLGNKKDADSTANSLFNDDGTTNLGAAIYTAGGELEASPPEGAQCLAVMGERLWLAGAWHRDRVLYSKAFAYSSASKVYAPEFNESFALGAQQADDIVAIAPMGSSVVIFSRTRVYAVQGEGPNNLGGGSTWSTLTLVVPDSGCVDWRSVASTPIGVFFQSDDGLMLLTPAFDVIPIGKGVEDTLASYPFVTSAVVVPSRAQVRFSLATDAVGSGQGRIAVYDWNSKAWFVWALNRKITVGPTTTYDAPALVSACVHDGVYYGILASNEVIYDTDGAQYHDSMGSGAAFIAASVTTPWLSSGGVSGYLRLRDTVALVDRGGTSDVRVTVYYDQDDTQSSSRLWTEAQMVDSGGAAIQRRLVFHPQRQKAAAIAVKVSTEKPSTWTTGGLCGFVGLDMQVGMKAGTHKVRVALRS